MPDTVREEAILTGGRAPRLGSKFCWSVVWGGMGVVASVNALAPRWILASWRGAELGVLLVIVATVQLAGGISFLPRKELLLTKVVLVLFCAGLFGQRLPAVDPGVDFGAYYVAAHLAAEHPPGRLYYQTMLPDGRFILSGTEYAWRKAANSFDVPEAYAFIYPPFFAALMEPFTHLRYGVAYSLWSALTALFTLASVWIGLHLGGMRVNLTLGLILIVGLFSFSPFFQELEVGQVASLILFLCALGVWLLSRSQDWPSAFCFAVATMIKLTPVAAIPILAMHRKWRWLTAYGCWMGGLVVFSIWRTGWAAHDEFLHGVLPSLSCGVACSANLSIVAFVQELILGYVPQGLQTALPPVTCLVSKAVSLVILALAMLQFYRYRREENLVLHLVLVVLLSLALSPITWMHHYVIGLLPFLYLWCKMREPGTDILLLATVLVVGTNITVFPLPLFVENHAIQLVLAGVVPCLTLALVYSRVSGKRLVEDDLEVA